jgi:hypothetical protein
MPPGASPQLGVWIVEHRGGGSDGQQKPESAGDDIVPLIPGWIFALCVLYLPPTHAAASAGGMLGN